MKKPTAQHIEEEPINNAFETFLRKHRRGQAANEASASMQEAIQAACETGKKATLTLTVKIEPKGDDQVQMSVDVGTKLPKVPISPSMFWVEDGQLHTSDPRQPELPLRELTRARDNIREAAASGE